MAAFKSIIRVDKRVVDPIRSVLWKRTKKLIRYQKGKHVETGHQDMESNIIPSHIHRSGREG